MLCAGGKATLGAMKIDVPRDKIADFCRKWKIAEMALFGSALRDDFGPHSDIDVLIEFEPDMPWSLYEWVDIIEELGTILGRNVDLVE